MSTDHTEHQSREELQRAKDLSLRGTRPPVELPGYEADRLIGQGAFGEVWIGVDRNTGRQVAIKFYTQRSRLDWTLLSREVEKLVFLSADRYVVQLLEVGWDSEPPYYVMEYVEGGSLDDLLHEHGSLPASQAVEMFREIATGLIHAHGKGVLHCDLKPANILLDQDLRPRLADFGQSRLSHEQSPALGTLFFMAPEQADLDAVPDARWDVYAIGAILFCALTGSAPYRSRKLIEKLDAKEGLAERLARYRRTLRSAAPPNAHRRTPGVDRALAEIVDRCLAFDPERRFPNVQAVIDALHRRDESRVRNPLVFLGFVGPVLLLIIMALFGLRGYDRAMGKSEQFSSAQARKNNKQTASFGASLIQSDIGGYFRAIKDEARSLELLAKFGLVAESEIVRDLNERNSKGDSIADLRQNFLQDNLRLDLKEYLDQRMAAQNEQHLNERGVKIASLLAVDTKGRMLAVAYDHSLVSRSIGWNYAYRTYFHGQSADRDYGNETDNWKQMPPQNTLPPIRQAHFSAPFRSTTSELWKVAISTPIFEDGGSSGKVIGVLALTIDLRNYPFFGTNNLPDQFAVLIDGRQGVILQHRYFEEREEVTDEYYVSKAQLDALRSDEDDSVYRYLDPLAKAPGGDAFEGHWIAAIDQVPFPNATKDGEELIVLVQRKYDDAIAPVQELGETLKREGIWALGGVVSVILVLWFIVLRMLNEPKMVLQRRANGVSLPTSKPQSTTLEATQRS
jgi:serine/threonine protein kinase